MKGWHDIFKTITECSNASLSVNFSLDTLLNQVYIFLQEGDEAKPEETNKQRKTPSRIPPLKESFVKGTNTESVTQQAEISTEETSKENSNVNELTGRDESHLGGEKSHENDTEKDSQNNRTTENGGHLKSAVCENSELVGQSTKNTAPHVKQNFSKINVGLEYTGDDVQPLEADNSGGEEDISFESESEDESLNEEGDLDKNEKNEDQDDIRAAYGKPGIE